ncbi:hypothetical protein P3G55_27110, partial [Leptospira sp. 96542]|nr:hypothetical protein [Leptospira sp. 96542]
VRRRNRTRRGRLRLDRQALSPACCLQPARPMTLRIAPLQPEDRAAWEVLARGYKAFYNTPTENDEYARAWARLLNQDGIHGLGAYLDGELRGLAVDASSMPTPGRLPSVTCRTCTPIPWCAGKA